MLFIPIQQKAAFQTHKSRIISATVLIVLNVGQEAEFIVASDASNVGIVGVLLQEDTSGSLRLGNLKIVKQDIVPMIVRHLQLLRLCPVYGGCIYFAVNTTQ